MSKTRRQTKEDIVDELISRKETDFDLTDKEQKALAKILSDFLSGIHQRKRGYVYTHNRIMQETSAWFEYWGYDVAVEVPFSMGKFDAETVRFDLVAQKGKELVVIEVKDMMNKRDFGQLNYYADMLQKTKTKAKLYLAIDFLEIDDAMDDETAMGEMVKEIMEREHIGLIFVDKIICVICDNYEQLSLQKMPDLQIYLEETE
ncbi:MAG: element excision factor XisH family protein [Candidatus Woesearchaeota archaeon]